MKTYVQVCLFTLVCLGFALMLVVNTADAQATRYSLTVSGTTDEKYLVGSRVTVTFTLAADTTPPTPVEGAKLTLIPDGVKIITTDRTTDENGKLAVTVEFTRIEASSLTARTSYAVWGIAEFSCCRPPVYTDAVVKITPSSAPSPAIGEQLTISLAIGSGENVVGYQATVGFDSSALRYVSGSDGDYLPVDAFVVPAVVKENQVTLAATSLSGESNGDGTLATVTFEVIAVKASTLRLSTVVLSDSAGVGFRPRVENGEVVEPPQVVGDVNQDGVVNILDLVFVAGRFGQTDKNNADLNGDGIVNIQDLVLVAGAFGNAAAAPTVRYRDLEVAPTRAEVKRWLSQARDLRLTDAQSQRGIVFLEQLLASFTPKETALLPNYPNPFNPETWIPYRLATDAPVRLCIYDRSGCPVRTINLGHRVAGVYERRGEAIYWDGRNDLGEHVTSGLYFYTLTAGDYAATRRMLVGK